MPDRKRVAVVDYGMGNLFSVKNACEQAGLVASVTASAQEILEADAVILPGVGAFGDAMQTLRDLKLVDVLKETAVSSKPLVGICLGMQLMMTESHEFGRHQGLDIIKGDVARFEKPQGPSGILKVPEVCWNRICLPTGGADRWKGTLLDGLPDGVFMYFVHSFYCRPADSPVELSTTRYGHIEFCSTLQRGNVFACQYHPERSGPDGLRIYANLACLLNEPEK